MIQFASDHLVTEVLIHPQLNTLQQCMKNMLGSFTKHRQIINGGYTFAGTGAWVLQDGPYSYGTDIVFYSCILCKFCKLLFMDYQLIIPE